MAKTVQDICFPRKQTFSRPPFLNNSLSHGHHRLSSSRSVCVKFTDLDRLFGRRLNAFGESDCMKSLVEQGRPAAASTSEQSQFPFRHCAPSKAHAMYGAPDPTAYVQKHPFGIRTGKPLCFSHADYYATQKGEPNNNDRLQLQEVMKQFFLLYTDWKTEGSRIVASPTRRAGFRTF